MGTLHPLIVHLPIGILLLNAVFVFLSKTERFENLRFALPTTLFLGALSAIAACVTGWVLSRNGDYTVQGTPFGEGVLFYHQWLGISVAAVSSLLLLRKKQDNAFVWLIIVSLLTVTGHFGGTLTHGEGYLWADKSTQTAEATDKQPTLPSNIQEARVYQDIIVPILKEKCYSCHNATKLKGKLRLDDKDFLLRGGENGVVVRAGQADESELIKRMVLNIEDKHHMPPKGKTQPTEQDRVLLHWWINAGLPFDKLVKDVPQTEQVKTIFAQYGVAESKTGHPFIPTASVEKADGKLMDSVRKRGIVLMPVAPNSPYLQANFVSLPKANDQDVALLQPFAPQLIWLKLGNTQITDEAMRTVAQLTNLTRLSLDNTAITSQGVAQLATLTHLQYLNVVGTPISGESLYPLSHLTELREVFLYKTKVSTSVLESLKQKMPKVLFDTGGYQVPKWVSDTAIFKRQGK
ncbi:MAG: hypothetical protein JNL70_24790 [Saprospiraceae bacterium]|nr:hypothetical protein [Saprospiraceae bacterium]